MKLIRDPALLEHLLEKEGVRSFFSEEPQGFRLVSFQKHELLSAPEHPQTELLFIVKGSVQVYGLHEDGRLFSVSQGGQEDILGVMGFIGEDQPPFYAEALEDTLCLALPIEKNRAVLEKDCVFLRRLLLYTARLVKMSAFTGISGQLLEERVAAFLQDMQPDHTLHSIHGGVLQFHCSRRQLQRVVKKMCEDGVLEKIGRGKYRLRQGGRETA